MDDDTADLYEHAPCGYLSTQRDGTIVRVNQTFLSWTGYRRDDLVGRRRFQDLLSAGGRIFYETHYAPLLMMQGSVREVAVDVVGADGTPRPALVNSVVKHDAAGQPVLIRTTVFEAAERRAYERELLLAKVRAEESEARARLLAETLQKTFVPPAPPRIPGLDLAGVYRPAGRGDEVGGDFYDVFERARGDWAVVLGDVCGKGAEAAAVTALARYTVRAAAMQTGRPAQVLAMLNAALLRQHAERFCTVVYARVRHQREGTFRMTVASGGHPLPLRVNEDGTVGPIGRSGHLLGVIESPALFDVTADLRPGDAVVLYTDGVTEGRSGAGFFGEERLIETVWSRRKYDAAAIAGQVADDVVAFQEGLPRDDIAIVVIKVPR